MTPQLRHLHRSAASGFTLTELMVAVAMGVLVALVAGDAMVSHVRSSARAEALQRQRDDWSRATSFIESEIAMSERVITNPSAVSIPSTCNLSASDIRLALDIRRDLPVVIYGVRNVSDLPAAEQRFWRQDPAGQEAFNVLIRCGPSLGDGTLTGSGDQDYLSGAAVQAVLVDGLDPGISGGGFCAINPATRQCLVNAPTSKQATFILALKGVRSTYSFGAGTYSRINPVATFPDTLSSCDRACDASGNCSDQSGFFFKKGTYQQADSISFPAGEITDNDNTMICGLGGQDQLFGTQGHDVIDAGSYPLPADSTAGATIDGGSRGRNFLFGTPGNDFIRGGDEDDTLVGRGGGDIMEGGKGNNTYLPWMDTASANRNATITGDIGQDVVYLRGNRSDFGGLSSCRSNGCSLSQGSNTLTMTNVNVLVFKDARVDLP